MKKKTNESTSTRTVRTYNEKNTHRNNKKNNILGSFRTDTHHWVVPPHLNPISQKGYTVGNLSTTSQCSYFTRETFTFRLPQLPCPTIHSEESTQQTTDNRIPRPVIPPFILYAPEIFPQRSAYTTFKTFHTCSG